MSNQYQTHVSIETARELYSAGYKPTREIQRGDSVLHEGEICVVTCVFEEDADIDLDDQYLPKTVKAKDCQLLPTLADLLAFLRAEGKTTILNDNQEGCYVSTGILISPPDGLAGTNEDDGDDPTETVGKLILAALKAESEATK